MAIKKSELYSSLWKSCDELRGGMDASQYKDYVLVLLFVKYVSDKAAHQRDYLLHVPKGGSFADMVKLRGDKEIGDKMNQIIAKLAEANDLGGVIDVADFNDPEKLGSGKDMVDRLSNLVAIFDNPALDFRRNRAEGDDLLGDAYEYLMRHFATESGKSKGQFYTPAEVSRVMAKVIGLERARSGQQSIYDPTCGSGSLLLKAHDEAKSTTGHDLTLYGQERDNATWSLARMNMILHGAPTAEIAKGNTLASPLFLGSRANELKTFDFVVANPPFSAKAWTNGLNPAEDAFGRFALGIPPQKNGDYAFLLHMLTSLKSTGKGACILPHGVLFRGGAEGTIRRAIVERGYIKGIIGLPPNLFYGTGIPACIVVLDKEQAATRKGIFMIDASKGFIKDGNKNRLRAQDIHRIVDTFNHQVEVERYSRFVPLSEVATNDFNLNLPRYIDSSEPEDLQDLDAHLRGGIPNRDIDALQAYWDVFPGVRKALFKRSRAGYAALRVPAEALRSTTFDHEEFRAFADTVSKTFAKWKRAHRPKLVSIAVGDNPKALIHELSEKLLAAFAKVPLLDPYDVYQHLMDYWQEAMQDDVYQVAQEGWQAVIDGKPNTDLIPMDLVVARYFAKERAAVEALEAERDAFSRQLEELDEEHAGEDGLLAEARTDKGRLTRTSVRARLRDLEAEAAAGPGAGIGVDDADPADDEEATVLAAALDLIDQEAAARRQVRDAQKELDQRVAERYATLDHEAIVSLVVDDKWLTRLATDVQSELDRVTQALTGRIRTLADRYAKPLPDLELEIQDLAARVDEHLRNMGVAWQ